MKKCFKCGVDKELPNFYKHPQMADGYLGKCKECNKLDSRVKYHINCEDPAFYLKERERSKEKYIKHNYREKQRERDAKLPWKNSVYKNLNRRMNIPKGMEIHHWNYQDEFLKDFFVLSAKDHKKAHSDLKINIEARIFSTKSGELLDTKEKHLAYLISKGINLDYHLLKSA